MKLELQQIEATLHQLASEKAAPNPLEAETRHLSSVQNQTLELPLRLEPLQSHAPERVGTAALSEFGQLAEPTPAAPKQSLRIPFSDSNVKPASVQQATSKKALVLPKLKQPNFSSHRNGTNPYLAMSLLKEMEKTVTQWQTELQQILRQIQDLYLEGPIIEGWLESLENEQAKVPTANHSPQVTPFFRRYRLCGMDAEGQFWSRPCPPEQLPSISLAIARYQKLRQLLSRKQELETRLTQLAETLTVLQGQLQTL